MLDVILSCVVAILNGVVWYSPTIGFGKTWAGHAWPGKTLDQIGSGQNEGTFAVCILSHLAVMILFKILSRELRPLSLVEHVSLAIILSLVTIGLRLVHLPFESLPLVVVLIDSGYDAANLIMSSVIQYFWKSKRE